MDPQVVVSGVIVFEFLLIFPEYNLLFSTRIVGIESPLMFLKSSRHSC